MLVILKPMKLFPKEIRRSWIANKEQRKQWRYTYLV